MPAVWFRSYVQTDKQVIMRQSFEIPYPIKKVTPKEDKQIKKCLMGYTSTFVRCTENGYIMPGLFKKHAAEMYNMEVRPDDIWVITVPRSGTTWTQEMVWLIENELNFKIAKELPLHERFPMLEITCQIPELGANLIKANFMNYGSFQGLDKGVRYPSWKTIENMPSPRFIKTHLPLSMLPPKLLSTAKVVYVARDPRDVMVSYYFLHKMVGKSLFRSSIKTFWELFRKDLLPWTPIVAHANEAWEQRHHPNLHFIFYEDMIKDLPLQIRKMCKFLNRQYAEDQIDNLANHLNFKNLKKNKNVNNMICEKSKVEFVRKGEAGGWKEHFDDEMTRQAEEFLTSRLKGLNLSYSTIPNNNKQEMEWTHL